MKVVLYSTECPRCKVLKKKLDSKGISYDEINDVEVMKSKGFVTVPILDVEGLDLMDFTEAVEWINSQEVVMNAD